MFVSLRHTSTSRRTRAKASLVRTFPPRVRQRRRSSPSFVTVRVVLLASDDMTLSAALLWEKRNATLAPSGSVLIAKVTSGPWLKATINLKRVAIARRPFETELAVVLNPKVVDRRFCSSIRIAPIPLRRRSSLFPLRLFPLRFVILLPLYPRRSMVRLTTTSSAATAAKNATARE